METLIREVLARQKEIAAAVVFGNWLTIAWLVIAVVIGMMLALLLVKVLALCRKLQC